MSVKIKEMLTIFNENKTPKRYRNTADSTFAIGSSPKRPSRTCIRTGLDILDLYITTLIYRQVFHLSLDAMFSLLRPPYNVTSCNIISIMPPGREALELLKIFSKIKIRFRCGTVALVNCVIFVFGR